MNPSSSMEWWRAEVVAAAPAPRPIAAAKTGDSSVPFWALMSFTFVTLIAPQKLFPVLAPLRIALLAAAIAMTTYLWDRLVHRRAVSIRSREVWLAAGLAAWALLTIPLSYSPAGSLAFFFDEYAKTLAIFWLLANVLNSAERLRRTFWALSLMAVPLALTGVQNFLSGVYLAHADQRIAGYEGAMTGNPNDLALMLNLVIPLSVALLLIQRKPLLRALLVGGICFSVAAVIVTFSRAGFVTLAALLLLYLWRLRRRRERRWIWLLVVFLLFCIPLAGPAYLDRLATIADIQADKTGSAQMRWDDMAAALRFAVEHPVLGAGIGQNLLAVREERGPSASLVHNVYLEYAIELGIPGLAMFLMLLIGGVKSGAFVQRQTERMPGRPELFYLAEAVQLSLLAFAVSALFHPVAYHIHFYYIAGLAVAAKAVYESEERRWKRTGSSS